jgi:biofilm PGA synthesis N-glycosyltransferase PgaC
MNAIAMKTAAIVLFWSSAALIAYAYALYPAWLWLHSRLAPRPWRRAPITPSVSIIVAVHNGATIIREQLQRLLQLDYPTELVEIIVVSDGSTDATPGLLRGFAHPRVRIFICDEHRGKAAALNAGIREGRNELLVFVDARPQLERGALRELVSNFADAGIGCAGGELRLCDAGHDAATSAVGGFYWRLEQAIRKWESQLDSCCGVYGGFHAVRRALIAELPAGLVLDDMYLPARVVQAGFRAVIDSDAIVCDIWPQTGRGEFRRKVRTLAGNFQLLKLAPWLLGRHRLRFQLFAHKWLRLAVPAFLAIAVVSSALLAPATRFYLWLLLVQAAFYALAALGMFGVLRKLTAAPAAFVLLNAAAVAGFWKFITSGDQLWKLWKATPPPLSPVLSQAAAATASEQKFA